MRASVALILAAALLGSGACCMRPARCVSPEPGVQAITARVDQVNVPARTLAVGAEAGQFPKTIILRPEATVVLPDGRQGTIGDIREGDRVQACYHEACEQMVADEVRVLGGQRGAAPRVEGP